MQYRYIGRCAMGYVEFRRNDEVTRMHIGEEVEVPDWLAAKLANNNHFELVKDDGTVVAAKRGGWPKGKPRKPAEEPEKTETAQSEQDDSDANQQEPGTDQ